MIPFSAASPRSALKPYREEAVGVVMIRKDAEAAVGADELIGRDGMYAEYHRRYFGVA